MRHARWTSGPVLLLLASLGLVAGCKEDIVFGVTQAEAIEIVVELGKRDIQATVLPEPSDKEPMFKLQVDAAKAFDARRVLLEQQLPKVKPKGLAEIFKDKSMIPTATEENAQLLLGLQGDLEGTFETIDDVVDAQVHIVLPEANPLESEQDRTEARAAVLIKYRRRAGETRSDVEREEARAKLVEEKASLLMDLRKDLRELKELKEELDRYVGEDDKNLDTLESFLAKKRQESPASFAAIVDLRKSYTARENAIQRLKNQPKLKDIGKLLEEIDKGELHFRPIQDASVRNIVANAIPRLKEDSVAVEFHEVKEERDDNNVSPSFAGGIDKRYFIIVAIAAALMTLGVIGLGIYVVTLQKKIKGGKG